MALFISLAITGAAHAQESINLRRTTTVNVVERTKGAVVYISTQKLVQQRMDENNPFFDFFPQQMTQRNVPVGSLGSGFIVHPDGYIVTNNHVIDRARQISVTLNEADKPTSDPIPAELISADAEADLAVLKIKVNHPLPTLELGDSADLMIGEPVIAIGNPLGYSFSVSTGIVSALDRQIDARGETATLRHLIQTDSAINAGNSGGPLLNAYGQVIGINTAIAGDAQNIGFAIMVDRLRDLIPALMDPAVVNKVDIPLKLQEKRRLTPPATIGVSVEVNTNDKLQTIDTIAGKHPANIVDAYALLLDQKGQEFKVKFTDGESVTVHPAPTPPANGVVLARSRMGVEIEQVTPMLAEKRSLQVEDGVVITKLLPDSPAAKIGLRPGDVIQQLGRYRIVTLDDLGNLLDRIPAKAQVPIVILRGMKLGQGRITL